MRTTISQVLAGVLTETMDPMQMNYAENRGYAIAVGHLGGICSSFRPPEQTTRPHTNQPP